MPQSPAGLEACCLRLLHLLFPHLEEVQVDEVGDRDGAVVICARARGTQAPCRGCGVSSVRVHGRYQRQVRDLAAAGHPALIDLEVRRFLCGNPACELATFAEQVPALAPRYQRRTPGLRGLLEQVALALAGRAGVRMAGALGVPASRSTLLRMLRALPDPEVGQILVLGVDDFAKRRGHSYGTVLVDLGVPAPAGAPDGDREDVERPQRRHRVVDVLDGRTSDDLAEWLREHPGVKVICRDRAGAYADGATEGAPDARQVADRWHLWHNLGQALDKTVRAHRACLCEQPAPDPAAQPEPEVMAAERPETLDSRGAERPLVARTRERYAQVQKLQTDGMSLNAISRELGLAFRTVRRFAGAASVDDLLVSALNRSSKLDEFKPYLARRWNEGCTDAAQLHAEIKTLGWTGSRRTVQGYLQPLRGHAKVQVPPTPPPKPRRIIGWIMSHPDHLDPDDQVQLKALLTRCPELDTAAGHVRAFAKMMTNRDGHLLDEWITTVTADDEALPHLASFARNLRNDHAAVTNGLTLPYSSGPVEGTVNKIKMLKRQMFGRANLDLLRIRLLHNTA